MSDAPDPAAPPPNGFVTLMGLHLHEITAERVTASLDAGPQHHQPTGLVHGGVHAAIVETVASMGGWAAVRDQGLGVVGVHNATDFLRPHREGMLHAVGRPLHVGRTQQIWDIVITRESDDKVVARGQVRLQNVAADGSAQREGGSASS